MTAPGSGNRFIYIAIAFSVLIWLLADAWLKSSGYNAGSLYLSRGMLIAVSASLLVVNRHYYYQLWTQKGSGFNLAVFRILFFTFFVIGPLVFGMQHIERALLSMTDLPQSSRVPLPFWGSLTYLLPVNATLSRICIYLLLISGFFAMIGFKTRASILLFTLAAFYVLGVPQLFGKINHNHELVWFPAILAFSGCGDYLSVDCWLKYRKFIPDATQSHTYTYGRAFAGIWLLIGIIYFFPGFQKIWVGGLNWIVSDNLWNLVVLRTVELPGWHPLLPLPQYPYVTKWLAAAVVVFEMGFIVMVVRPAYRFPAIIAGVFFHLGTWFMLDIFFPTLLLSYTSMLNWERWFRVKPVNIGDSEELKPGKKLNAVVIFLVVANCFCGVFNIHSWPVSTYPAFSTLTTNQTEVLEYAELTGDGKEIIIPRRNLHQLFPVERYRNMELRAIQLFHEKKQKEFEESVRLLIRKLKAGKKINVYVVKISWTREGVSVVRQSGLACLIEGTAD